MWNAPRRKTTEAIITLVKISATSGEQGGAAKQCPPRRGLEIHAQPSAGRLVVAGQIPSSAVNTARTFLSFRAGRTVLARPVPLGVKLAARSWGIEPLTSGRRQHLNLAACGGLRIKPTKSGKSSHWTPSESADFYVH